MTSAQILPVAELLAREERIAALAAYRRLPASQPDANLLTLIERGLWRHLTACAALGVEPEAAEWQYGVYVTPTTVMM